MAVGDIEVEDCGVEVPWEDICGRLKLDARMDLFLHRFQESSKITSSLEAFAQIPTFLGDYMVREFDYRTFCVTLGTIDAASSDDPELWTAHMSKNLNDDLVAACSLMLRLAMTIAKAHGLEVSDWLDINTACSNAIRSLPACYRLQRALPGALCVARAWKHLPAGPDEASAHGCVNPWDSIENSEVFEEMYNFPWIRIQTIFEGEKDILGAFSGRFRVEEVKDVEGICLVSLEAQHIGTSPAGFPMKPTAHGDVVLLEVEAALGNLLEKGFCIEGDFYELNTNTCFLSNLLHVSPEWAP